MILIFVKMLIINLRVVLFFLKHFRPFRNFTQFKKVYFGEVFFLTAVP